MSNDANKPLNFIGKKVGRLTVVEEIKQEGRKKSLWKCKCSCSDNNEVILTGYKIINQKKKSCGCLERENRQSYGSNNFKDLTNLKFGRLTALEYLGSSKWSCICDCGKPKIASSPNLIKGDTVSCGCKQLEIKERWKNIANEPEIKIKSQKTFRKNDGKIKGTRISSLKRAVSKTISSNRSGKTGVAYCERDQIWRAYIIIKGEKKSLGSFGSYDEAVSSRKNGEDTLLKPLISMA